MLTQYQKEALDYKYHILLSANAGSGKTFVLAKRFLNILLNEEVELENLIAITFTDKAAGELNKKIAIEIEENLKSETNDKIKSRLESIRRQLVSANISTIHSFCVNILREFAPEAGIDANFIPIDQIIAEEILDISIDESINSLIKNPDYEYKLKYLIRFFGSRKIVEKHIKSSIYERKIVEQLKVIYTKSIDEIKKYFDETFKRMFKILFESKIDSFINAVISVNKEVISQNDNNQLAIEILNILSNYSKEDDLINKIYLIKILNEKLLTSTDKKLKTQGYLKKNRHCYNDEINIIEQFFDEIKNFYDIQNQNALHSELARFGKCFIEIHDYVLNIYNDKKHSRGYLDFEDILLFTKKILEYDEVRDYLRKKYKYIMIDEYQDTNELQYKIFMPILEHLRKGNLFVVGDEKQSIYMFRDAELEIFNKTKEEIKKSEPHGKLLNLPHSFRMAPQIVLFTNKLFSKLFDSPNSFYNDVEYSELICTKDENEKGCVEIIFADIETGTSEAEMIANKIINITTGENKKVYFKEIGILCRKRDFFEELEKVFIKKKIPYRIIGGKGFYQRQIIYDIFNYISFLLNPNDDLALIGVLRAPFFTVSDTELFDISLEEGDTFFEKLINKSLREEEYKKIVEQLNEHRKLITSTKPYFLIRKILLDTNYWSIISAKRNSEQEIANLKKLIALARIYSQKSFKNLYDFVFALKNSIKTVEDESQAQIVKDENAVNILTIHQAKGLEFKAVFLYSCNDYGIDDTVKTKSLSIDKNFGLLTKVPINNNYFGDYLTPPIVALYNHINNRKNIAELKRLFYVAVTRAMNYLFISLTHKKYRPNKNTFFYFIDEGLNPDYSFSEIEIKDKIKFMKHEKDNYRFFDKEYVLKIPMTNEVVSNELLDYAEERKEIQKEILIQKLSDIPREEIFSATKISIFNQCPVKYELIYELGYSGIFDLIKKYQINYEFNFKEEEEIKYQSDLKGRIIHSVLKENPRNEDLFYIVEKYMMQESLREKNIKNLLMRNIVDELSKFCSSQVYKNLLSTNSKNEIEIYCKEGEHFLYGIIDKLIFDKNQLIIVDYKTDSIKKEEIKKRADEYFIQLKFYAYVLSKCYPEYNNYLMKIIFINYPEDYIDSVIKKEELINFGMQLNNYIEQIIQKKYIPDFRHCNRCHFAINGDKCIKIVAQNL